MMLSISLASWADSSGSVGPSSRTLDRMSSRRPPRKTKENRVKHKPLHSVNSLEHDFIAFDLGGSVQVADVGGSVVGLSEVGVAEGVGHAVVEPLDGFTGPLSQVLKADAKCLRSVFWCISLQKFDL